MPTVEQLTKIKTVLDEAKQVAEEKESAITRVFATKKDIEQELLPRLEPESKSEKKNTPEEANPIKIVPTGILKYINENSIIRVPDNYWINQTFAAFQFYWSPSANITVQQRLVFLFAPAARSIFELSFNILRDNTSAARALSLKESSKFSGDHIKNIVGNWRNNQEFLTKVVQTIPAQFDSAQSLANLLNNRAFRDAWSLSNPGAHTGAKHFTIIDLENVIQKAEIFALLAEHFVAFSDSSKPDDNKESV